MNLYMDLNVIDIMNLAAMGVDVSLHHVDIVNLPTVKITVGITVGLTVGLTLKLTLDLGTLVEQMYEKIYRKTCNW